MRTSSRTRRWIVAAGFPVALLLTAALGGGAGALPAWAWLLALALLALLYPLNAWRDAPLFPTPLRALDGLAALAPLPAGARVIDAGCGLGDGLRALRRAYPDAQLTGIEWSWPLVLGCRVRCPWARVQRADLWRHDWGGSAMVYLFQRPESMAAAAAKACREIPGGWLASLAFEVDGWTPVAVLPGAGHRLYLYRVPSGGRAAAGATGGTAPR